VYWLLAPLWPSLGTHILGDQDTDTIRGMWGFDHLRRSLIPPNTPLWSEMVNFPEGAVALVLPWISGQLLAPLGGLFGPLAGYNLGLAVLLWAAGFCTAVLVYETTSSWPAAAVAGGAMLAQPMLLHAIGDGTPEHLAVWSVPLFLAAAHRALVVKTPRWGILTGLAAGVVVLDSPYHAIYALCTAPIVLPWAIGRLNTPAARSQLLWTICAMLLVVLACGGVVYAIYSGFDISTSEDDSLALWQMNATDLRTWWKHEYLDTAVREASLAPTLIPSAFLWGGLLMCLLGVPRSLPWALTGLLMILLSLGLNPRLPLHLTFWLGDDAGEQAGRTLLRINKTLYTLPFIGMIRFPQRWLVPAAMCILTGAGFGARPDLPLHPSSRSSGRGASRQRRCGRWSSVQPHRPRLPHPAGPTHRVCRVACRRSAGWRRAHPAPDPSAAGLWAAQGPADLRQPGCRADERGHALLPDDPWPPHRGLPELQDDPRGRLERPDHQASSGHG
jgi:hypothetical protein